MSELPEHDEIILECWAEYAEHRYHKIVDGPLTIYDKVIALNYGNDLFLEQVWNYLRKKGLIDENGFKTEKAKRK